MDVLEEFPDDIDKIDNDILNYIMNIIYHIIKSYDKNNKLLKEKINLSF